MLLDIIAKFGDIVVILHHHCPLYNLVEHLFRDIKVIEVTQNEPGKLKSLIRGCVGLRENKHGKLKNQVGHCSVYVTVAFLCLCFITHWLFMRCMIACIMYISFSFYVQSLCQCLCFALSLFYFWTKYICIALKHVWYWVEHGLFE